MSLRRKSCNACFQGRRKCDLAYPTCQRCRKMGKTCQYVTEPASSRSNSSGSTNSTALSTRSDTEIHLDDDVIHPGAPHGSLGGDAFLAADFELFDFDFSAQILTPAVPNLVGELGSLKSLHGDIESWRWVAIQLRKCPENFAKAGENMFMHPSMYSHRPPPVIKAAFGVCTASQMVTPATKTIFASSLEGEVERLRTEGDVGSLCQRLARLQAILMYQIMRLFGADSGQRAAAERHKDLINMWALRLLHENRTESADMRTYEGAVLAESVRRTVMATYLLHAISSIFKHGICTELPTLALLPISIDSEVWESNSDPSIFSAEGDLGTLKYGEWADAWVAFPPRRRLDRFQKMMMVACKGKAKVEELETETMAG